MENFESGNTAIVGGPVGEAIWFYAATSTPSPTAPLMMTGPLPPATVGVPYSQTLTATGGTPPLVWSVDPGSPQPPGITLAPATGVLSGTPTAAGTFSFTVVARDAALQTATRSLSLTVSAAAASAVLEIISPLPSGRLGSLYNQTIAAAGGTPPYAWSVVNGALPAGILLSPTAGGLSGTPTVRGSSTFSVVLTDAAARTVTARFMLAVE